MLAAIQGDWVRLVRVVAIGQEIDVADVRVELIALEVRDAGPSSIGRHTRPSRGCSGT
jgi:hypothetical protein